MYCLTNKNITKCMDGDISTRYIKFFNHKKNAQKHAEKEHGERINWSENPAGMWCSGDLGHTMYYVVSVRTEDE